MRFKVYKDYKGEWRWRLLSSNNRILADSGEAYVNKQDCLHAVGLVQKCYNATVEEE